MLRALVGVAAAAAIAFGVVYGWQLMGHSVFPFLAGIDLTDPLKREVVVGSGSLQAQAWVVAGYAIGVLVGGVIGNLIADARWPAVVAGVMLAAAFFATLTATPHPFWMQVTGVLAPVLVGLAVAAWVGRRTLIDA